MSGAVLGKERTGMDAPLVYAVVTPVAALGSYVRKEKR